MTNTAKTGIAIVIIIIVIVVGWVWYSSTHSAPVVPAVTPTSTETTTPVSQGPSNVPPTPEQSVAGTGLSASSDMSNSAIDTDTAAIDAQLKALNSDNTNTSQDINDSNTASAPAYQ